MRKQFDLYKDKGYAALFVCASAFGPPSIGYVAVPEKAWPWGVLDSSDIVQQDPTVSAVIAFDLRREFDAQMPEHMRQIDIFDCFWARPLINIPDRSGVVPADKRREFEEKALKTERPSHLKLVVS